MTNGELIRKVFNCEVCEPIPEDDIIHVIFPDKDDSAIGFDWSWWNMEYKEQTTKNNLVTLSFSKGTLKYSCKDYVVYKKDWLRSHYGAEIDIMFGDSQYKEPTTKNDLGVDLISRADALDCVNWGITFSDVYKKINDLPSVTPQPMVVPIAEVKIDEDKFKELANRAVLSVIPQEPILDKIRAEIAELSHYYPMGHDYQIAITRCIAIIDKYKAESES